MNRCLTRLGLRPPQSSLSTLLAGSFGHASYNREPLGEWNVDRSGNAAPLTDGTG
jgi:hypothetical protein